MVTTVTPLVLLLVASAAAFRRAHRAAAERSLWGRTAWAALTAAAGSAAVAGLAAAGAPAPLRAAAVVAAGTAAFLLQYGALIRWNRVPTALADPHDTLNGVSSVLAATGLLATAVRLLWPAAAASSASEVLVRAFPLAVALVCLGTAASLPALAGLARDVRFWLVSAALALASAAAAGWLLGLSAPAGGAPAWVAGCFAAAAAAVTTAALRPQAVTIRTPADPVASTLGAFSVLLTGLVVLAAAAATDGSLLAVATSAAAVAGAGLRLRNNVGDLASLALTRRLAHTDDLTGLANRRALLAALADRRARGVRVLLAVLDLDRFKEVNDGLGHAAGDELISAVARRLAGHLPGEHLLARLGGDEFAVLADADPTRPVAAQAAELGGTALAVLAEPFQLGAVRLHVSTSVGVAVSEPVPAAGSGSAADDGDQPDATELLRRADAAMYEAKRDRDAVVVHDAAAAARSTSELLLVEELRSALVGGGLVLQHQPQVCTTTGRTTGVEALVRWQHPERGLLPPGEFLPSAEAHGLMGQVTEVVLELAVAQLARWRGDGLQLRMSVNLSASNLLDTGLPQRVAEMLHRRGVPAAALVLEVTESVLISDPERSLAVLDELAALGVGLSIDDFGTGYSSLTYLQRLPVHELKLDRSFTVELLTNPRARAVAASTVDLAHALSLRVVAEGVEDVETLAQLVTLGCDETQGYLHSRPVPAAELERWLRAGAAGPAVRADRA